MISSLLHRLSLVEQTLTGNSQLLSELQLLEFEAEPCQRDVHLESDLETLSHFLRRLEPRLQRSANRHHLLTGAVIRQKAQLTHLKSLILSPVTGPQSLGTRLPIGGDPFLHAAASSFLPDEALPRGIAQRYRQPSRRNSPTDCLSPSGECLAVDARCRHLANPLGSMLRTSVVVGVTAAAAAFGDVECTGHVEGGSIAGLGVDATDFVVEMLEAEIQRQERVIHRMMLCNETLASKEQEYERRNEWYEHKMRLLKQDKRKRGETIGKLLRCIDDMRETGGARPTDDSHDYTVTLDRAVDQGGSVGRGGPRSEARAGGGWTDDVLRDVYQELDEEHAVSLSENDSLESCRPTDDRGLGLDDDKSRTGLGSDRDSSQLGLGSDEDRSQTGLDRHQKQPDFIGRHLPSLLTRSTGREFFPALGPDMDNRNRRSVALPFAQ